MNIPKWLEQEVDKVNKNNKKIAKSMEKIEDWLSENNLIKNEDDGFIRSIPDEKCAIERADIESGLWTGARIKKFLETGEIDTRL